MLGRYKVIERKSLHKHTLTARFEVSLQQLVVPVCLVYLLENVHVERAVERRSQHTGRRHSRWQEECLHDIIGISIKRPVLIFRHFGDIRIRDEVTLRLGRVVVLGRTEHHWGEVFDLGRCQRDCHCDADEESRKKNLGEEPFPVATDIVEPLDENCQELLHVEEGATDGR